MKEGDGALADTPGREWQTAYYLGVKARAAGDAAAATDWFHGALDPAEGAAVEARWRCTCWPISRATCSASCPASTW